MKKKENSKTISIAFLGNINNNYYNLINSLTDLEDFQFSLYLNTKDPIINLPTNILTSNNLKVKKIRSQRNLLVRIFPRFSRIRLSINKYNLLFLSAEFITLAPYCKIPAIFFPTGADLTQAPFPEMYDNLKKISFIKRVILCRHSIMVRKGIHSVKMISTYPYFPFIKALDKLSINWKELLLRTNLPLALDPDFLKITKANASNQSEDFSNASKILIAARIIDQPSVSRVEKGSWKNVSEFICGMKIFLTKFPSFNHESKIQIQIISRDNSPDFKNILELINSFGMLHLTTILYPENRFGFSRNEFSKILQNSDLIIDDFGIGWFGSLMFETLSQNKCYMSYVDNDLVLEHYVGLPVHNCLYSEEIAFELEKHYFNCNSTHSGNQQWIEQHFGKAATQKNFLKLINEIKLRGVEFP